ncbi:hypothetical protein RhiirC2_870869 [Rhizophagus irregularis]|uniref:Uncharacterized protein n=1 Tax=Rhizophagus irregularis TaxID=588596 RepID=A0A2N1MG54_9GLOM|nr:hypothetical protein RhiirC2_870869 [Rhizophagus irregularis]
MSSDRTQSSKIKILYNQKVEQGIRHELSVFTKDDNIEKHNSFDIQIPEFSLEAILMGSNKITAQSIADLFDVAIKVGQKENLYWYCFYKAYEDLVEDYKVIKNIDDQLARTLVYNEIKLLLPDITDGNLRLKTFRAKKIYTLFTGIGIDKIKRITYGTYAISCLKDFQIQGIINSFPKKPTNMDECQKVISVTKRNAHVTESSEVSILSIPITQVSNASGVSETQDDSSKIGPVDSPKSQVSIPSTSSSDQISESNQSRLPISILPEDPEEKRKHIIGLVLERFPYLSLEYSESYGDRFVFNSLAPCPMCNKDHEGENLKGGWGDGGLDIIRHLYIRHVGRSPEMRR